MGGQINALRVNLRWSKKPQILCLYYTAYITVPQFGHLSGKSFIVVCNSGNQNIGWTNPNVLQCIYTLSPAHLAQSICLYISLYHVWIQVCPCVLWHSRGIGSNLNVWHMYMSSSAQSSIGPLYYEEFLDLASPPRARISRKYAQYSIIIVNTDGAAGISSFAGNRNSARVRTTWVVTRALVVTYL